MTDIASISAAMTSSGDISGRLAAKAAEITKTIAALRELRIEQAALKVFDPAVGKEAALRTQLENMLADFGRIEGMEFAPIDGSNGRDVLSIIYDIEGLALGDPEESKTDFDDKFVGQRYVGTR